MEAIAMKKLILYKQKHDEPKLDELSGMLCDLEDFLNADANPNDMEWNENMNTILGFQDNEGCFNLLDSYDIPIGERVNFCYVPTYVCTAILMKAYMTDLPQFTLW